MPPHLLSRFKPRVAKLFLAWDKGNLPVDSITLEEFDLVVAFGEGVMSNSGGKNQTAEGPATILDPRKVFSAGRKSFKERNLEAKRKKA